MRVFSVLYYTSNYNKYISFREECSKALSAAFNAGTQARILDSFIQEEEQTCARFSCLRELSEFLAEYNDNLSDLTIVMDCDLLQEDAPKTLQTILIEYLEIKFLFDADPQWVIFNKRNIKKDINGHNIDVYEQCLNELEHCTEKGKLKQDFKDKISSDTPNSDYWVFLRKLFKNHLDEERVREIRKQLIRRIALDSVRFDFLMLPEINENFILNIVHTQDNLFDASNLRYCINQWKYAELDVHSRNFLSVQNSRRDNLAICIEEEKGQNRFNSYCLFACGFRVLPITSATELLEVNKKARDLNPSLIIRDYDLQFFDSSSVKYGSGGDSNGSIKAIRGFRDDFEGNWTTHVDDSPCWSAFYQDFNKQTNEDGSIIGFPQATEAFICKSESAPPLFPIVFISKGSWNLSVKQPVSFISEVSNTQEKKIIHSSHYFTNIHGVNTLCIPGLLKPISGIYEPFMCIPKVRSRVKATKTPVTDYINTSREGHAHGTSLNIYATVISLIQRAEFYFNNGKYIHAAILSNEAIEYLNGFHEALLLKAYQILTVSENAIAMDTIGGDENALKEDTLFRIKKIEYEIDKILRRKKDDGKSNEDRREFKYNVLNQIFSSCRNFCKGKEHFSAEDCFISAMAHTNEGFTLSDIRNELLTIRKRIMKSWTAKKNDYKF